MLTWIDWLMILGYFGVLAGVVVFSLRRNKIESGEDLFLGGRSTFPTRPRSAARYSPRGCSDRGLTNMGDAVMKAFIESGKAVMGIEFGSTRIKAVLVDDGFRVVAQGAHDWENRLVDGVWSYSLEDIEAGVRDAYAKCAADAEAKCDACRIRPLPAHGRERPGRRREALPAQARQKRLLRTGRTLSERSEHERENQSGRRSGRSRGPHGMLQVRRNIQAPTWASRRN